jgi:uncharacterized protein YkwD
MNMRVTIFIAFFLFLGMGNHVHAQQDPLAIKILQLVNAARADPAKFLKEHRAAIEGYEPRFVKQLERAKPCAQAIWDPGLSVMSKESVESNNLGPKYAGKLDHCGFSSGSMSGNISTDALSYVSDFYTSVNDPGYSHLGLYFNKARSRYTYYWAISCDRAKMEFTYDTPIDSSKVDFAKLNTAKNEAYLTAVEKRMVLEINFVRAYPKVYAQVVARYLADKSAKDGGLDQAEYEAGLDLMDTLKHMAPASILTPMQCIYDAAKVHGLDCAKRKILAHEGSDGSDPWDRILKKCTDLQMGNENLAGNAAENPRVPVMELLIDDGIPGYGHRYNMLDASWKYVGVYRATGERTTYYTMYNWVQNFGR